MGKGDIRSKRGKIRRGTYGNTRLRKKKKRRGQQQGDKQEGFGGSSPRPTPPA
ncbi:MAG: 30S ribosomal protein THX [Gemmatimonadetes bacterium]|nr:MAG: 30S ribosomal protein THX [Gemmatimonadota bacterium]PYP32663.1 MAG: 30S ribosomal protein THX [Gemmatimonadota bacterium]